ncbi:hypothetical protein [Natronomonas sp. EA1]|uniref:hypothetical protein n=1 Tax=Natronomonas sp. EA1 TaxID=3421655 RepID=UPI003EB7007F
MDFVFLHTGHFGPPPFTTRLLVNVVAGLFATIVMNIPMKTLREGQTPPFVAASALSGDDLPEVPSALASGIHYGAGMLGGVLYTLLVVGFEDVVPVPPLAFIEGTGLALGPHLLAGAVVLAFLYGFFAYLVLPRFGQSAYAEERRDRVRADWLRSALVYVTALLVLVPLLTVTFV